MRLFRRLQLAFEPTVCGILLHRIRLIATLTPDSSRSATRRYDGIQPRAALWTPAILDLSHAGILAEWCEVSIPNMVVVMEYSTLENPPTQRMPNFPPCFCWTLLLLGTGESSFENVADRLPATTVELNQSQVFDRPKVPTSGADFDSG